MPEPVRRARRTGRGRKRPSPVVVIGIVALAAIVILVPSWYGTIALSTLIAKMLLSMGAHRAYAVPAYAWRLDEPVVTAIVPMYNEDPEIIRRTIRSLLNQTRPPDLIHVIDDGSTTDDARTAVSEELHCDQHRSVVSVHHTNMGKREAIATAVAEDHDADIFLTVDSDTVLDPDALRAILPSFNDPRIMGATGLVRVLNRRRNLLTRLVDLRYANAFMMDRGAQSAFGSVLCACGSLAAWRREVIVDNLEDFTTQKFLGQRCTYGDDRRLTNYALARGRVALVPEAVGHTAAPERLGHYLRQQLRWNKSFVRESMWAIAHLPARRPAMWLAVFEFTSWVILTAAMLYVLAVFPLAGGLIGVGSYLFYATFMAWARSLRWHDSLTEDDDQTDRWGTFLIAPLYALIHLFLLLPLRVVAVLTLRQNDWGTRQGVEVVWSPGGGRSGREQSRAG
jgi:hyaluronan synthase